MKSKEDIERALKIMKSVNVQNLKPDEAMAHNAVMDFARWALDKPCIFGSEVFDPHVAQFPDMPTDNNSFSE